MLFDSKLTVPALSHTSQTATGEQPRVRKDGAGGGERASRTASGPFIACTADFY